jgi:Tfp pilus assembly protein PilF
VIDDWAEPDEDAHVRARERFESLATIYLCESYVETAKRQVELAIDRIERARKDAHEAFAFLNRTVTTLEIACKLHAMARDSE